MLQKACGCSSEMKKAQTLRLEIPTHRGEEGVRCAGAKWKTGRARAPWEREGLEMASRAPACAGVSVRNIVSRAGKALVPHRERTRLRL